MSISIVLHSPSWGNEKDTHDLEEDISLKGIKNEIVKINEFFIGIRWNRSEYIISNIGLSGNICGRGKPYDSDDGCTVLTGRQVQGKWHSILFTKGGSTILGLLNKVDNRTGRKERSM